LVKSDTIAFLEIKESLLDFMKTHIKLKEQVKGSNRKNGSTNSPQRSKLILAAI
jgi:hypothetical protein